MGFIVFRIFDIAKPWPISWIDRHVRGGLGIMIDDIAAGRAALEAAGVKFDGATEVVEGMVATATFYDPDGNAMMLAQDLTGTG